MIDSSPQPTADHWSEVHNQIFFVTHKGQKAIFPAGIAYHPFNGQIDHSFLRGHVGE
jgi:hypothetical protein